MNHHQISCIFMFIFYTLPATSNNCIQSNSNNTFSSCHVLHSLPATSSLEIFWTIITPNNTSSPSTLIINNPNNNNNNNITLHMGLSSNLTSNRWVALGIPTSPGVMIDASAIILCNTASPIQSPTTQSSSRISCLPLLSPSSGDNSNNTIQTLYLGGKTPQSITSPGHLLITNESLSTINSNSTTPTEQQQQQLIIAQFVLSLPPPPNLTLPIIYATGPLDPSTATFQMHDMRDAALLDLKTGQSSHSSTSSSANTKKNVHAWLMAVGWSLLIIGGVIARSFRVVGGFWWFQLHRALQLIGVSCIIAALIVIFSALNGQHTIYHVHFNIGIAASTLAFFQIVNALFYRPRLDSRWRRGWALIHHWVGRSALVLGIANVYYGMIEVKKVDSWAVISYSVVLGVILGVGIVKEGIEYLSLPPPAVLKDECYCRGGGENDGVEDGPWEQQQEEEG